MSKESSSKQSPSLASDPTLSSSVSSSIEDGNTPARWLPKTIGKYRIIRLLGHGGMGAVYEAEQEQPRRTVALKVIKPGLASPDLLRRFAQEAHALGRLQHPGIAQIYDAGTADTGMGPQPYFAMEFIRGTSLRDYAEAHRPNMRERLELVAKICDAVQHAHQRSLIHRDLKPANILVDETGQPKILDFGLARASDSEATLQTSVGQIVGTLAYMSPEQVAADPLEVDTRTDIYALGVILYELLGDRLPHNVTGKLTDAVQTILNQDPPPLSSVKKTYRGDVETIVAKALEKDKARRYASAAELAADLRHYLRDEPIVARPPSTTYQLHKFARRHKGLVVSIVAVFVVLLAGAVVSTWQAMRARRAEKVAVAERDRANQQAQAKDRIAEFLKDLFRVSDPSQARGNNITAREILDEGVHKIDRTLADQPDTRAELMETIGEVYASLGLYSEAERLQRQALGLWRGELHRPDHPTALKSAEELGHLVSKMNRNEEAEALLTDTVQRLQRVLGSENRELLRAKSRLAFVYRRQGRLKEAEALFTDVISIKRRVLGNEDTDTISDLNNLSIVYGDEGRYQESVQLFTEILETRRRQLGEEHPLTLAALNNLANAYRLSGRFDDARALLQRAIMIAEKILGPTHPEVGIYVNTLGEVELESGDLTAAERDLRRALAIYDLQHGYQYDGLVRYELAEATARQRKQAQALEFLRSAVDHGYKHNGKLLGFVDDPNLKSLHGNSFFEQLIAESRQRESAKQ